MARPGPDEISAEIYKLITTERALQAMTEFFNSMYDSGQMPSDWLNSVVHTRINKKCEEYLSKTQFGFRNGFGTREALFGINVLIQRCRDISVDIYACFTDFQKIFDRIKHDKLMKILGEIGLDAKDIRITKNFYWNQTAVIRNIIQEKIAGKRGLGIRKISWLKNLRNWYGVSTGILFRVAVDKVRIVMMVTNVLKEH
ncbi:PREDICTED: uncharacterized protein LOC106751329, partial [Dinoponera quadriceps]|uniref:Uncharacterized protein LOC106751329 n=1 Tax=Dinoponera quadriceps TaxID=609295 RepID=A0A6P3YBF6_DINQU